MKLGGLLQGIPHTLLSGSADQSVDGIASDSREVSPGDLFVCYQGVTQDLHQYIPAALDRGAVALVVERPVPVDDSIACIQVVDGRHALAEIAANYYGRPADQMRLAGITGTNGKTSSAYMAHNILKQAGRSVGLLGTVQTGFGRTWENANATTPDALKLQAILHEMHQGQVDSVVMEVTSHALAQQRVAGMQFDVAAFTNLTQDHLDFHTDMADYLSSKIRLFQGLKPQGVAVLNADDPASRQIADAVSAEVLWYSTGSGADFQASDIRMATSGIDFVARTPHGHYPVHLAMLGEYNVHNALAAISIAHLWECSREDIQAGLADTVVPGRFELVPCGREFTVVVDYAHTPDALERLLHEARKFARARLICVFGCGGDRDQGKRPKMGKVASTLADHVVVTSDNPRTEDPDAIIADIMTGVQRRSQCDVVQDRKQAIHHALANALPGDLVVIAGKGHEDYQILGDTRIHFDDREIAAEFLTKQT